MITLLGDGAAPTPPSNLGPRLNVSWAVIPQTPTISVGPTAGSVPGTVPGNPPTAGNGGQTPSLSTLVPSAGGWGPKIALGLGLFLVGLIGYKIITRRKPSAG